jgi:hypothetical protein
MYLWCDQFYDTGQHEMILFSDSGHKAKSHTVHSSYVARDMYISGFSNVVWP